MSQMMATEEPPHAPSVRDTADEIVQSALRPGELEVPPRVLQTVRFLQRLDVWFKLSRNREAHSCRDAANKRWRLGHEGIEIWNELKSFFGRFTNSAGGTQCFIAHCRGDRELDFNRLQTVLRARDLPSRLTEEDLSQLQLGYGLVNPFETWRPFLMDGPLLSTPVLQVFDREVATPIGVPGTMMTNAGDFTWAVEFDIQALLASLDNAVVADISQASSEEEPRAWGARELRPIGIITGNGPESGMALWANVNKSARLLMGPRGCGDVSMPPVSVYSLPALGLTMELDEREQAVWRELRKTVVDLCRIGVRNLAIACHTTQYFTAQIRKICSEYGTDFISMAETLGDWLRAKEIRRIALVGIRYVSDLGQWSAYRDPLSGVEVEQLSAAAFDSLHMLAYQVKVEGPSEAGLNRLRDILRREVRSQHVVLALTELSLLMQVQRRPGRSDRILIDPLALYGEALACRHLGMPFPATESDPAKVKEQTV